MTARGEVARRERRWGDVCVKDDDNAKAGIRTYIQLLRVWLRLRVAAAPSGECSASSSSSALASRENKRSLKRKSTLARENKNKKGARYSTTKN